MREHILPLGESGFQARRGPCGLRTVSILNTTKEPHRTLHYRRPPVANSLFPLPERSFLAFDPQGRVSFSFTSQIIVPLFLIDQSPFKGQPLNSPKSLVGMRFSLTQSLSPSGLRPVCSIGESTTPGKVRRK
jgi:hypothetical protein